MQKADSLRFDYDDAEYLFYTKNGNNLIITRTYDDDSIEYTNLSGFFKSKAKVYSTTSSDTDIMTKIKDEDIKLLQSSDGRKIIGPEYSDGIYGNELANIIYTYSGNDTISAGEGGDTIYLNGKGNKTINLYNGDGNDIISDAHKADKVTLNIEAERLFYSKKGNNLFVARVNGDNIESTAITNFFKKKLQNIYISKIFF